MSTFAETNSLPRYRRSLSLADRATFWMIALLIVAFIAAFAVLPGCVEKLPAPSAGFGVTMMKAGPARVGVCAPGSAASETRNAIESILSRPSRWSASWCGFGDKTILQCIAATIATKSQASPRCSSPNFSGRSVLFSGAGRLGAHESDTGVYYPPQAAPGNLFSGVRSVPSTAGLQDFEVYRTVAAEAVSSAPEIIIQGRGHA